jgi:hypothetical protein
VILVFAYKRPNQSLIFVKSNFFTFIKKLLTKTPYPLALKGVKVVSFGLDVTFGRYVSDGMPEEQVLAEMGCLVKE